MKCPHCRNEICITKCEPKPTRSAFVPWTEANAPDSRVARWKWLRTDVELSDPDITYLDHTIEGLQHWAKITDTVMVTTRAPYIDRVYETIERRKPDGLNIIGGIKLDGVSPDLTGEGKWWSRIALDAAQIAGITGVRKIALLGETLLTPFHRGDIEIDFKRLAKSLKPLADTGIEFQWHPIRVMMDTKNFPDRFDQTIRFVDTVLEAVPNSKFLTAYRTWKKDQKPNSLNLIYDMQRIVGRDRIIDRLFVTPDGNWWYPENRTKRGNTVAEAIKRLEREAASTLAVYPGALSWPQVARAMAEAMA